jgi:hypothetical protein
MFKPPMLGPGDAAAREASGLAGAGERRECVTMKAAFKVGLPIVQRFVRWPTYQIPYRIMYVTFAWPMPFMRT